MKIQVTRETFLNGTKVVSKSFILNAEKESVFDNAINDAISARVLGHQVTITQNINKLSISIWFSPEHHISRVYKTI
jgi:hypothetical protein